MRRALVAGSIAFLLASFVLSQENVPSRASQKPRFPGPNADGFLLPNGWTISPAGQHVVLTDMPLGIAVIGGGKSALVATSGYNDHILSLVDLATRKVTTSQKIWQSWFGLAVSPNEEKVWWSGGGTGLLHSFRLKDGSLTRTSLPEPENTKENRDELLKKRTFRSGLLLDSKRNILYSLDINAGTIATVDPRDNRTIATGKLVGRPYDVVRSRNDAVLFVSDWANHQVLVVHPEELRILGRIPVGEHPNQMAVHPGDERVFVACASTNCVSVIDAKRGHVTETIFTSLFPRAPEGSTPCALALAPDGKTLFVANADNNCVAVIDVVEPGKSVVKGFIPTGWYPTAVAVTPDGKTLLVGVGKGNQTKPNPITVKETDGKKTKSYPYIGTTMSGALSIVPMPNNRELAEYTKTVYRNCPYSDKILDSVPYARKTAIPTKVGDASPIKHVLYIIKENRTYDQVFGDVKEGNGDPSLVLFGEQVTPNHHKLAKEFVLLDNLYCNGQVSRDGHPWSTMAYNTDYIARDWHLTYSRRIGVADDDEGNLAKGPSGYLWDACARNGLSYRSYGEYGGRVSQPDGTIKMEGRVPGLVGHMCPDFGIPAVKGQTRARDTDNVEIFLKEFRAYEEKGDLPRFMIMSLGEDHTTGTTPGTFKPEACVASNDLALGRLVEAVSKSKSWPKIAIFVIEDDAQNGPDHVDAHRTVGLVVSPYTKRHHVDSTQYATVSMIRTIELILGLPPLSQYDAAARPMFESFTDAPDLTPYVHAPARIDLNAKNQKADYGADRSSRMDFSDYDKIDDFELNEILWRAIKGKDAPIPPVVRRAIAYRPMAQK